MSSSAEILAFLLIVLLGSVLGRLSWRGLSLGTSGVIFVALLAGHLGWTIPDNAGLLGLVVFVYCLGIDAGPRFFRMFRQHASWLAIVGVVMLLAAAATTWLFARAINLPADLATGVFAGALTSTPALAAAAESLPANSQLAVGFGIAYPIGAIGVVLFVQLAARFFTHWSSRPDSETSAGDSTQITREVVEVLNPNIVGKRLSELSVLEHSNCQISRARVNDQMVPIPSGFSLQLGQQLMVIGSASDVQMVVEFMGRKADQSNYVLDTERQRRRVVATSESVVGQSLKDLHLRSRMGVTITRIVRHDLEFVPDATQIIQFGDALTAIGEPAALDRFVELAGHRERSFDETDLISLAAGLFLGVLVGCIRFELGGETMSLGMAGGPLIVGLVMGHFGRIGPIVGHFPRAARLLLTEIGLAMFLADSGVKAGKDLLPVLQAHGVVLCGGALLITAVPLFVGLVFTRYAAKMSLLRALGAICGAMTSTPGLGALTSKLDSNVPVTSYATVYPIALILMSLLAPVLVSLLS